MSHQQQDNTHSFEFIGLPTGGNPPSNEGERAVERGSWLRRLAAGLSSRAQKGDAALTTGDAELARLLAQTAEPGSDGTESRAPGTGLSALLARWAGRMGVRGTLILLVVVITTPFLVLALVNGQRNLQTHQVVAEEKALMRARLATARVDDLIGNVDSLLMTLTETLSPDPADIAINNARLAAIGARLPPVHAQLRISSPDGNAIGHSAQASVSVADRKYFRDALVQPGLVAGEASRSYRDGNWTVGFARAIHDASGAVKAVVSLTLRLDHLHEIMDARDLPAGSRVFLISEKGIMLARSSDQENLIGTDVSKWPTGSRALAIKEGTEIIVNRAGVSRLIGAATTRKVPWVTVVALPIETAFADVRRQEKISLVMFGCALVFALVAGLLAARRVIGPIRRITADAVAFGGGDLTRRSHPWRAPVELAVLAGTFNRLADDIAARTTLMEESESRYRSMFLSNPQPMWVFDRETLAFLAVNAAAVEHYGYSREEFLGMTLIDIRPPGEEKRLRAYFAERGSGKRASQWRHRRKDGREMDVQVSTHDLIFEGRVAQHSVVNDITDRLRMEGEICRLNQQLEDRVRRRTVALDAANRELEAITYSVSHDLRNPLRSIDGFAKLLHDHAGAKLDAEGRSYLDRIRGAAQGVDELIGALLGLSRVSRGALTITRVDLSALATQCAADLQRQAPQRDVEWRISPGLWIEGDADLLRSVLGNLLGNAWKYTGQRPRAMIEFGSLGTQDGMTEFYVRDNGSGFDMAHAGRLFLVFQRLHSRHDFEGTGIGLATVHRIIERHGGTVRGEGKPDVGASIHFCLPAASRAAQEPSRGTAPH